MEKITIVKSGTTTLVTADDEIVRKHAITQAHDFCTKSGVNSIQFPSSETLTNLHISAAKLSTATLTALSLTSASTINEVFDAFVTADFFSGK